MLAELSGEDTLSRDRSWSCDYGFMLLLLLCEWHGDKLLVVPVAKSAQSGRRGFGFPPCFVVPWQSNFICLDSHKTLDLKFGCFLFLFFFLSFLPFISPPWIMQASSAVEVIGQH